MTERKHLGFAAMTVDRRKEISRTGGRNVPREKRAFAADPEKAREAGRKGGQRRREANAHDIKLLRESVESPVYVPAQASGRTLVKVARLCRLGYWQPHEGKLLPEHSAYEITEAGLAFLASLEG